MPERVFRPSFKVSALVVTVLAAVGFVSRHAEQYIPELPANRLAFALGDYARAGAHQPVDWRPLGERAFAEARQTGKPILMVVGTPWSQAARRLDEEVFTDLEIANHLNRDFVSIRVDGSVDRRWLSAFFPLSRIEAGLTPGLQIVILEPNGQMLDLLARFTSEQELTAVALREALLNSRQLIDRQEIERDITPTAGLVQRADLFRLRNSPRRVFPVFESYTADLKQRTEKVRGGTPVHGVNRLWPNAWRYLLALGHTQEALACIDPLLLSPIYDYVHGGFFRQVLLRPTPDVEFDKLATQNAEMALLLASLYRITGNQYYRYFAEETCAFILDQLVVDGYIATAALGPTLRTGRSRRYSFGTMRTLRSMDFGDRIWAARHLNLGSLSNQQRLPYVSNPALIAEDDPNLSRILGVLRSMEMEAPPRSSVSVAESHGHTVAKLLLTARLLGSQTLIRRLGYPMDALDTFRESDHALALPGSATSSDYLGDYLAVSDALLSDYLAVGRYLELEAGLDVLKRSMLLFEGEVAGELLAALPITSALAPQDVTVPEVVDSVQESCSARFIRLASQYALLFGHREDAAQLRRVAFAAVDRYSSLFTNAGPIVAGYMFASLLMSDHLAVMTVGPSAKEMADEIARAMPFRLVAPALGPVRPDLQNQPSGAYLVSPTGFSGPFTVGQVKAKLGPFLRPFGAHKQSPAGSVP